MLPLFEKKLQDHLRFSRSNIDETRHKRKTYLPQPEKDNKEHGENLLKKFDIVIKSFKETEKTHPPIFDPSLIFKIRLENPISEDEWRRSNLTILSEESDGAVILFSPDQLTEFKNRIGVYQQPKEEDKKHPSYSWIASVTEDIKLWGRENRIGQKLLSEDIDPIRDYYLDIELWSFGEIEEKNNDYKILDNSLEIMEEI